MAALDARERAELERLRAEVAELRAAQGPGGADGAPGSARWRDWGRTLAAVLLIALGCALTPLSVAAVWARGQVTDTDRYVATVAPLAYDPAVRRTVTTKITDTVFQYIDVRGLSTQAVKTLSDRGALPPQLAAQLQLLITPLANGVYSFTEDQVGKVVQSEAFAQAWTEANRAAHEQLVAALTGSQNGAVVFQDNAVKLNLAPFVATVKDRLVSQGFALAARIPAVNAQVTVFTSEKLPKVQQGYRLLNTLGLWLPLICLALVLLGVYLARDHRLAFVGVGLGVTLAMLLSAGALALGRRAYLGGVPPEVLPADAAAVLYDTVVGYLREAIRAGALLGSLIAAGAFLTGPARTAVAVRRVLVSAFATARGWLAGIGARLDAVTGWVAPRAHALRFAVLVVALAVLMVRRYKTPELVAWLTVGVLVAFAVIQLLATPPRRAPGRRVGPAPPGGSPRPA